MMTIVAVVAAVTTRGTPLGDSLAYRHGGFPFHFQQTLFQISSLINVPRGAWLMITNVKDALHRYIFASVRAKW